MYICKDFFKSLTNYHSLSIPSYTLPAYQVSPVFLSLIININGLSNVKSIRDTASQLGNIIAENARATLKIKSPSKVFYEIGKYVDEGLIGGLNVGAGKILNTVSNIAESLAPIMNNVLGDVFDLSPTLNNTTSSSSNVNVTVYNNMETDFMGNLVNNIKTFSNGSKNDYNYGMS